jgi:catechol 2,3-dioxygenase-like lactoylglutathione lyase family enzyme
MSYQPKYLGHVNIFVRSVERSHRWYADVLGLHTYGLRPGQVAFLSADLDSHMKLRWSRQVRMRLPRRRGMLG